MANLEVSLGDNAPCGLTLEEVVRYVIEQIKMLFGLWVKRVSEDPANFEDVEREALEFSRSVAGLLTAAVLAHKRVADSVEGESKRIRSSTGKALRYVRRAGLSVTLLCGLTLWLRVGYWLPKRSVGPGRPRGPGKRGKEGVGLYPELAALGIREGVSAPLQEEVARTALFLPSFDLAQQELAHRGISLDIKTVLRITRELGEQAISARKADMEAWRRGECQPEPALHGRKVVVSVDGGRMRLRETTRRGRRTKKGRHRFKTPWREPKLLRIYTVNEHGRRDPGAPQVIEITRQGPDHVMELAAFHLYRLGAQKAQEVVFLADGAEWIWDRVPKVAQQAGLSRWSAAVDFCHAMGYLLSAVNTTLKDPKVRKRLGKRFRRDLSQGRIPNILDRLRALPEAESTEEVKTAIGYFKTRAALMKYDDLRAKGLPIGSGAVESAIRRVINLRVKSPGMFWDPKNAEGFLYLRANALSGQWKEMLQNVSRHTRTTRQRDWEWEATPYSHKAPENDFCQLNPLFNRRAA